MQQRLAVLPPALYGVRVFRGPGFTISGYGDEAGGQDELGFGHSMIPSLTDLHRWAKSVVDLGVHGSWSPWRTVLVSWDCQQNGMHVQNQPHNVVMDCGNMSPLKACPSFYYKAGDDGSYDIAYDTDSGAKPLHYSNIDMPHRIIDKIDNRATDAYFTVNNDKQFDLFRIICAKFEELVNMYARYVAPNVIAAGELTTHIIDTEIRLWVIASVYKTSRKPHVSITWVPHSADDGGHSDSDSDDTMETHMDSECDSDATTSEGRSRCEYGNTNTERP
jgi:hypothetical protein